MPGGQHQFFVIARVEPHSKDGEKQDPHYRCVAALHHQWMKGPLVISPVLLFVELCRNPYNARVILAELASIAGRFGAHGYEKPRIGDNPCPYISQMLCISVYMRSGPTVPYSSYIMPVVYSPSANDYDDAFTVFDVTDPTNCRYCHRLLWQDPDDSDQDDSDSTEPIPISTLEYLKLYNTKPTDAELLAFQKLPLISPKALAEAWPWEYAMPKVAKQRFTSCDVGKTIERAIIPSLCSMAHKQLLPILLAADQIEYLPEVVLDDSMKSFERRQLLGCAKMQRADLALLNHIFRRSANVDEEFLDLSGLNLNVEDITNLDIEKRKVRYIDLSSSSTFPPTIEDLIKLGTSFPFLESLNVLNCSNVDAENIKGYFARNGATYQIIHPEVLTFDHGILDDREKLVYKATPVHGSQFAVIAHTFDFVIPPRKSPKNRWIGASVRYFNLAPALQVVHDVVARFARRKAPISDSYGPFSVEFMSYLTSGSHLSKSAWAARPFLGLPDKIFKFKADDKYGTQVPLMTPKDFTSWSFLLHEDYLENSDHFKKEDQPQPMLEYSFIRFEDCKAVEICDLDGFLQRNRPLEGAMERLLVDNLDRVLSKNGPLPTLDACDTRPEDKYNIQRVLSLLPESKALAIAEELFTTELYKGS